MIVVINFGSQLTHLIAKRVRELNVYSEVLAYNTNTSKIASLKPEGIILSGGPSSVYEKNAPSIDPEIFRMGIPVLGICYGMQLIGKEFGSVKSSQIKEFGKTSLLISKNGKLLKNLSKKEQVWMSHGDSVAGLNRDFSTIASTGTCAVAAIENSRNNIYGVQFHPEVVHTPKGTEIFKNFLFGICRSEKDFDISDFKKKIVDEIKNTVGDNEVLIGVSGGVDSTVAAVLMHEAIGDKLHCVFIDHGLMRKNEKEEVDAAYKNNFNFKNYYSIDASKLFLRKLKGVSDPEEKRKVIGHTFIQVFEQVAKDIEKKHPKIKFLCQGTIYPDRIESAQPSKHASKIKSHHNLTLPEKMNLKLIEPLKELYKDDVRKLGKELGIPNELLGRHPFPGPGLGVRIIGEITEDKLKILKEADHIFIGELKKSGYYDKTWQALAALLPVRTVGVMGDARTYDYMIALRAVTSSDAMTADWAKLPHKLIERISARIVNEVKGVNRVVYDVTQKPPATIEYE